MPFPWSIIFDNSTALLYIFIGFSSKGISIATGNFTPKSSLTTFTVSVAIRP